MKISCKAFFIGSKQFGFDIFKIFFNSKFYVEWVIIHPDDLINSMSKYKDFRLFTEKNNIKLFKIKSNNELDKLINTFKPEFAIVCGWYSLFRNSLINLFPKGMWGIHNSLLPLYRGGSPLVWSIINGDQYVGSSLFKIDLNLERYFIEYL